MNNSSQVATLSNVNRFNSFKHEFLIELKMACREPSFFLPTLLFPLMFYTFFGLFFGNIGGEKSSTYLMVSYGVFGIMSPALFGFGASVASEREKGWLALKQISPVSPWQYMAAKLLNALFFAGIIVIGLFTLGAVFGGVVLTTDQWLSLAALLLLGTLPFCALGLAVGFWVKGNSAVAILNLIFLPSAFLSGLAIPVMMFPSWLQQVATVFPPFHLSQLGLKIVGLGLGHSVFIHIGVLVATLLGFTFIAVKGYQRSLTN